MLLSLLFYCSFIAPPHSPLFSPRTGRPNHLGAIDLLRGKKWTLLLCSTRSIHSKSALIRTRNTFVGVMQSGVARGVTSHGHFSLDLSHGLSISSHCHLPQRSLLALAFVCYFVQVDTSTRSIVMSEPASGGIGAAYGSLCRCATDRLGELYRPWDLAALTITFGARESPRRCWPPGLRSQSLVTYPDAIY